MDPNTPFVFTLDLEDHRPDNSYPKRYPDITLALLDFLEHRQITATVFVLGRIADSDPELIRAISNRGHEIGFHSPNHVHLTEENPERFRRETVDYKRRLEDLTGSRVLGYRAPAFSLTKNSYWAVDILRELEFVYSSSVLPGSNPIFGFPGAPRLPFKWPNGLLELPAPIAQLGGSAVPFLGGIYLRYLPLWLIGRLLKQSDTAPTLWTYCHPHDFDAQERFFRIKGTSLITSLLLWFNRGKTYKKLDGLLALVARDTPCPSFQALISRGTFADAPEFRFSDTT